MEDKTIQNGGSNPEGLELLHLSPKETSQLDAMAITTLEQLALNERSDFGLGKKGETLITRARNILSARHTKSVAIFKDAIEISLDRASPGIIMSIKASLGAYDGPSGNCQIEVHSNSILLKMLEGRKPQPCHFRYPSTSVQCKELAMDYCTCHGHYYCPDHFEGHTPSIQAGFARLVSEAQRLGEKIQQKNERDLRETGITLSEEEIRSFARQRGFEGFWQAVFEEIQGLEVMKQALAAGLFSLPREPVHVLVIGDPGSAKSLARDILLRNFTGLTPVGGNTTRAGLVCNRSNGEPGALAFSDGKLVLVDEFDKIDPVDLSYCLELLSNGRCDVHSGKIHQTIESKFAMFAFANPEGDIFSGEPQGDIGMRPTVMSRFALVVKVSPIKRDEMLNLFSHSFDSQRELNRLPQYYDQWLKLARTYQPEIQVSLEKRQQYLYEIVDIVEEHINTPLRRDIRMKDYLRRVPEAIARSEFSPVQDRHLEAALELFRKSLETWQ
jgi:hypothetical protein